MAGDAAPALSSSDVVHKWIHQSVLITGEISMNSRSLTSPLWTTIIQYRDTAYLRIIGISNSACVYLWGKDGRFEILISGCKRGHFYRCGGGWPFHFFYLKLLASRYCRVGDRDQELPLEQMLMTTFSSPYHQCLSPPDLSLSCQMCSLSFFVSTVF